jgi:hypothetical protein
VRRISAAHSVHGPESSPMLVILTNKTSLSVLTIAALHKHP